MTNSAEDRVEGKLHELKGAAKQALGKATDNPDLETEGQAEKIGGTVQKKVGEIKKVLGC